MNKFQLIVALLIWGCLQSLSDQRGKTYENLPDKIKNQNDHQRDIDEQAELAREAAADQSENSNQIDNKSSANNDKQNQSTKQKANPNTFSEHEIPQSVNVKLPQQNSNSQAQQQKAKKEQFDDPNSLSHQKFHVHGSAKSQEQLDKDKQALQYLSEMERKRKSSQQNSKSNDDEGQRLKSVTIQRNNKDNSKLYFLLQTGLLILMMATIVGGIALVIFMFYKLFHQNGRGAYQEQVDDHKTDATRPSNNEQRVISALSKIEEENEDDLESTAGNNPLRNSEKAMQFKLRDASKNSSITKPNTSTSKQGGGENPESLKSSPFSTYYTRKQS
eukprot:403355578